MTHFTSSETKSTTNQCEHKESIDPYRCFSFIFFKDLGVFIPPMNQGIRMDFFLEGPFMPNRIKLDRETLGGLADMFGQMPGECAISSKLSVLCLKFLYYSTITNRIC